MKLVLEKLEDGEELSSKELASISSALAGYERNRIAAAREDAKRDYAAKEAEYQSKIAELSSKIAELSGGRSGLSEKNPGRDRKQNRAYSEIRHEVVHSCSISSIKSIKSIKSIGVHHGPTPKSYHNPQHYCCHIKRAGSKILRV